MRRGLCVIAATVTLIGPARAYDFEPVAPFDVKSVEPAVLANIFGAWEIRDKSGKRRCRVTLLKELGIGGHQIELASGCDKAFPAVANITAWRLLQNWTIDLVDGLRKTRIRFKAPDDRYVAFGDKDDIVGIDELVKVQDRPAPRKK